MPAGGSHAGAARPCRSAAGTVTPGHSVPVRNDPLPPSLHLFIPCGHLIACQECVGRIYSLPALQHPVCDQPVVQLVEPCWRALNVWSQDSACESGWFIGQSIVKVHMACGQPVRPGMRWPQVSIWSTHPTHVMHAHPLDMHLLTCWSNCQQRPPSASPGWPWGCCMSRAQGPGSMRPSGQGQRCCSSRDASCAWHAGCCMFT